MEQKEAHAEPSLSTGRAATRRPKQAPPRLTTRVSLVEILEVRWLLAIDVTSTTAWPSNLPSYVAEPTVEVSHRTERRSLPERRAPRGTAPAKSHKPTATTRFSSAAASSARALGGPSPSSTRTIRPRSRPRPPGVRHLLRNRRSAVLHPPGAGWFHELSYDRSSRTRRQQLGGRDGARRRMVPRPRTARPNIVLIEANSNGLDLRTATDFARNYPGVSVISMSFGSRECVSG